ncbi:MAG: hypothetical protein LBS20_16045 [Prevotella sp.]|jgi:hypothetical protein|nr:hypothetical protein [Prevotella sp.]
MKILAVILMFLALGQPIIFIVGMIKPQYVLPKKLNIKRKRLFIFGVSFFLFFLFVIIAGHNLPKISETTNLENSDSAIINNYVETREPEPQKVLSDSDIANLYKTQFDSLYNELMKLDKVSDVFSNRKVSHKKIQKLLFEDWWNTMEQIDSTGNKLPVSRKEYEKACRKYDKQYARFILYGSEDRDNIEFWAKQDATTLLNKLLREPESLVIEKVKCIGKTKKGWQCIVDYRAKNGFGGYTREYITLIMAYNEEQDIFECVDAKSKYY